MRNDDSPKRPLTIDLDEFVSVVEDSSYGTELFFDLETGDVLFFTDDMPEETQKVENDPDRFVEVPRVQSRESYRHMQAYIDLVEDPHLQELLSVAIDGSGAFRRFKDVLLNYPEERQAWFDYKASRLREYIFDWLDLYDIEPIVEK
ncbi:MAG: hypothetical protein DPW16_11895 [Chloroflexi bacterium]|nr:hypothetical protein [Chloroflexota bacterium]